MSARAPAAVPELRGLAEAEDFFEALGVPYDRAVLDRLRLRVLKRFGLTLAGLEAAGLPADPAARREALAGALREAYELVARNGAREGALVAGAALVQLGRPAQPRARPSVQMEENSK